MTRGVRFLVVNAIHDIPGLLLDGVLDELLHHLALFIGATFLAFTFSLFFGVDDFEIILLFVVRI